MGNLDLYIVFPLTHDLTIYNEVIQPNWAFCERGFESLSSTRCSTKTRLVRSSSSEDSNPSLVMNYNDQYYAHYHLLLLLYHYHYY